MSQQGKSPTTPSDRTQEEADLKLRLLRAQVADAEADAEKAQLDLEKARRERDLVNAEAQEALEYTFYDAVNGASVKTALAELGKWHRRFPGRPLKIILNSPGGSVIAGLALFDYIRYLRAGGHHVTVVALGYAASMGGILLQAGGKRVIGREAMLLIHEVSSGTQGKVSDMEDDVRYTGRLWDKLAKILAERSNLTYRQIKARAKRVDWWLDASEAIKLGFADEIL